MDRIHAVALFADDIREEKDDRLTLVGVMPDNLKVPGLPGMLPKLAIFIRLNIPVSMDPQDAKVFLTDTSGTRNAVATFESDLVARGLSEAAEQGNNMGGVTMRMSASPFAVAKYGRVILEVEIGDECIQAGSLNILAADD